jgi:hypothetical protein
VFGVPSPPFVVPSRVATCRRWWGKPGGIVTKWGKIRGKTPRLQRRPSYERTTARQRAAPRGSRRRGCASATSPVAAHPPAVGVLLTHRPPCPPPSRVPSPDTRFRSR